MDPLLMMLILFAIMMIPMWLMSRSQRKRMQAHKETLKKLGVGDEVRTHSGFYGMIVEEVGDDTVILEAEDGSQLKWARQAIAERVQSFGAGADDQFAGEAVSGAGAGVPADGSSADGSVAGVTVDPSKDDTGLDDTRHNDSRRDFS